MIFLILFIRYFEYAINAPIGTSIELLELAAGIALVALALYVTRRS